MAAPGRARPWRPAPSATRSPAASSTARPTAATCPAPGPTRPSSSPSPRRWAASAGACWSAPPATTRRTAPPRGSTRRWPGSPRSAGPRAGPSRFNLMQMRSHGRPLPPGAGAGRRRPTRDGAQLRPQTTPRSIGVLFSLAANTLIDDLPSLQPPARPRPGRPPGRHPRPRGPGPAGRRGRRTSRSSPSSACSSCAPSAGAATSYGDGDSHRRPQAAARGVTPVEALPRRAGRDRRPGRRELAGA